LLRSPLTNKLEREGQTHTWRTTLAKSIFLDFPHWVSEGGRRFRDRPRPRPITSTSAWWELFESAGDDSVRLGCELTDGSYLEGDLVSYSTDVEESPNRELVLGPPIQYRAKGEADVVNLGVSAIVVSAGRLKMLTVQFLRGPAEIDAD
jgi:hypothetical protein